MMHLLRRSRFEGDPAMYKVAIPMLNLPEQFILSCVLTRFQFY